MANSDSPSILRWRCKHLSESSSSIPASPGVYVIGCRDSLHGFDFERVFVYVGESRNLRRRLDEHLPDTEQNPGLKAYLRKNYTTAVCWYAPVKASQLRTVQDDLIRKLQPRFNTVGL